MTTMTTNYNPRVYFLHSYHMHAYVCIYNNIPTYQFSVPRRSFLLYFYGFSAATLSVDGVIWILFQGFPRWGKRRQIHFWCGLHSYTEQRFRSTYRLYIYTTQVLCSFSLSPSYSFSPFAAGEESSLVESWLLFRIGSLGCDVKFHSPP